MALARRVASLGLGARSSANLKVRQPLSRALIYSSDVKGGLSQELSEIVADELNVKSLEFVEEESRLVSYRLVADGRQLGPKLGPRFPMVRAALAKTDAQAAVSRLRAGSPLTLEVDGEMVELAPDEIIIDTESVEGLAVAADKGLTVAVDAVLTPELVAEGLVRDIVRHVQTLRKDADYQLDERITVGLFDLDAALTESIQAFQGYLRQETLCEQLLMDDDDSAWDQRKTIKLGEAAVDIAVRR